MLHKLFLIPVVFVTTILLTSFDFNDPLTAKTIQQNFVKVNDQLYACKYEVSNLEYRNFLSVLKSRNPGLAEKYRVDSTKWVNEFRYQQPMVPLSKYYHSHPAYNNYPVVCISYEAALAYCDWLTEQYNADEKRKFKNVKFVLPTEDEWMMAAGSGDKNKIYPWNNYTSLQNKRGEYICNFKHVDDAYFVSDELGNPKFNNESKEKIVSSLSYMADMALYTADVRAFWPNSLDIYNTSGNVAEMINEKGLTKGGSWNSYGGEVTIQSRKIFNEASCEVGFRVFMKIISE